MPERRAVSSTLPHGISSLKDGANNSGGTVSSPFAVQYNSGKAALIRAVGCIQEELTLDGFNDIHIYALHPGGILTGIQCTPTPHLQD